MVRCVTMLPFQLDRHGAMLNAIEMQNVVTCGICRGVECCIMQDVENVAIVM